MGPGGNWKLREHVSALRVLLGPPRGRGEPGDSHPVIREWGGHGRF
jgi:hypothetical protein